MDNNQKSVRSCASTGLSSDKSSDLTDKVRCHYQNLYGYAFRLTGSPGDAEDLVQHAFLVLQQKGHQVRQQESLGGWLRTVVRNGFLKNCRRKSPQLAENINLDLTQFAATGDATGNDGWYDGERLQNAINELPPQFRVVIAMFYFEQDDYREIAAKLEIPIGTVMSRLSRAKSHLRNRLVAAGEASRPVSH